MDNPQTLPEMRAALVEDQKILTRRVLDTMNVPPETRTLMESAMMDITKVVIKNMADADVLYAFSDEPQAFQPVLPDDGAV